MIFNIPQHVFIVNNFYKKYFMKLKHEFQKEYPGSHIPSKADIAKLIKMFELTLKNRS